MYAASTAATASSELPNTVVNYRVQAVWYSRAAAPEAKKQSSSRSR